MVPVGTSTQVEIITDLKISGKVAQFGRGVMQDVSTKLLGQFADCLEVKIAETKAVAPDPVVPVQGAAATAGAAGVAAVAGAAAATNGAAVPSAATTTPSGAPTMATGITPPAAPSTPAPAPSTHAPSTTSASDDDDVLDLGDIGVGSALAKRAAPAAGALGLLLILRWLIRRMGSSGSK